MARAATYGCVSCVSPYVYIQTEHCSNSSFCSFMGSKCPNTNIPGPDLHALCGISQRSLRFRMLTSARVIDSASGPVRISTSIRMLASILSGNSQQRQGEKMTVVRNRSVRKYLSLGVMILMATSTFAASNLYNFTLPNIDGKPMPLTKR